MFWVLPRSAATNRELGSWGMALRHCFSFLWTCSESSLRTKYLHLTKALTCSFSSPHTSLPLRFVLTQRYVMFESSPMLAYIGNWKHQSTSLDSVNGVGVLRKARSAGKVSRMRTPWEGVVIGWLELDVMTPPPRVCQAVGRQLLCFGSSRTSLVPLWHCSIRI